jgi:hypothetical protein
VNQAQKWSLLLMLIVLTGSVGSLLDGCGHKAKLHAPPPRKPEKITGFGAELECGKVLLFWPPVFFDTRGDPIEGPVRYLVLRKRNERKKPDSLIPSPSPTIIAQAISGDADRSVSPVPTATPTVTPAILQDESTASFDLARETPTPTPSPTPTFFPADYDYKLIGILESAPLEPTSETIQTERLEFVDDGKPGVYIVFSDRFRKPKSFPPEKIRLQALYTDKAYSSRRVRRS